MIGGRFWAALKQAIRKFLALVRTQTERTVLTGLPTASSDSMPDLFQLPKVIPLKQGAVMPASRLYFYQTATSTPQPVYSDAALTTPITQPVTANSDGVFVPIFLDPNLPNYRVTLTDSVGAVQSGYPVDDYPALSTAGQQQYGVRYSLALGTANAIQVTLSDPDVIGYYSGLTIIIGDNVGNSARVVTLNVNGLGARQIYHLDGTELFIGEIAASSTIIVTYSELTARFEMVSANYSGGITGSYTATLFGVSGTNTFTVFYKLNGLVVTLYCAVGGSVTAASTDGTLGFSGAPAVIRPSISREFYFGRCVNNGNTCLAVATIGTDGVITLDRIVAGTEVAPTTWTGSGNKGVYRYFTASYSL
jgi:hypothetical protein